MRVVLAKGIQVKKGFLLASLFILALPAYSADNDNRLAELRADTPVINGGFRLKQFVVLEPGDKEVLGDEGVLYISPKVFTDQQLANIKKFLHGKNAIYGDPVASALHLANTCISATRKSFGKAGDAAGYLSLVLTDAYNVKNKQGISFKLYSWPDYWYVWKIERTKTGLAVDDSYSHQAWGWWSSRVLLTPDSSVGLDACLNHSAENKAGKTTAGST